MTVMAKSTPIKKTPPKAPSKVQEQPVLYNALPRLPEVDVFTYQQFADIAALVPFTQKEWAAILHLSERTLQRYARYNGSFEGIYVDRILQVEQLIRKGLETFTGAEAFYRWLKREKKVLGHTLQFGSLYTTQGIQDILAELGRIQHGVYI